MPAPTARVGDSGRVAAAALLPGESDLIHHAFLAQARLRPDAEALHFDGGAWSYAELLARTRSFAAELRAAGIGQGEVVAILAKRDPEVIVAMIGAARSGATFIVLDAAYPDAHVEKLLALAAPHALVSAGPGLRSRGRSLARAIRVPFVQTSYRDTSGSDDGLDQGHPDNPAYFLFTTGTTGAPKCVAVSHRPLNHFVAWQAKAFDLREGDRFTMLAGLSHDPLLRDIFTPLSIGASLAIPQQSTILEPGALTSWFRNVGATVTHLTPAMGQILLSGGGRAGPLTRLRHLFWGGDKLLPSLLSSFASLAPEARHTNFYGSTETPQAAAYFPCDDNSWTPCVPIGKGIDGFEVLVVDEEKRPVGADVEGEIAIRSQFLSLGYVNQGEIAAPTAGGDEDRGRRTYYTGDRGRYLPDGSVMILGRQDDQVKIRGYRVELSEITAALLRHPDVGNAVTIASGEGPSLKVHAFVAAKADTKDTRDKLASHLAEQLPAYMLPNEIRLLASLPLLPNGKLDRQALLHSVQANIPSNAGRGDGEPANDGRTDAERALISKFRTIPGLGAVSRDSSFASLGGDSLSYVQGYLLAEEILGVVPPRWQEKTIAELAGSAVQRSAVWSVIDSPMLIRAVAIVAIVSVHLQLVRYDDGGTTALFLVSGFLFGGLQLPEALRRRSPQPIFRSVLNVAIPAWIYAVVAFGEKSLRGHTTTLMIPFLANDLIDYQRLPKLPHVLSDYQIHLWYVDALIQMLVLLTAAIGIVSWYSKRTLSITKIAWVLFTIGCLTRFALPGLFWPEFFSHRAPALALVMFLPTTHFATLMLGVLVANAAAARERFLLLAVATAYAALTIVPFGLTNALCIEAATATLLFWSRIKVPRLLARIVLPMSGAALFIYLLHGMFGSATQSILPRAPLVALLASLGGGVLTWRAWLWTAPRIFSVFGRLTGRRSRPESLGEGQAPPADFGDSVVAPAKG
jgi:amino acid adenylation domain-containing protein